MDQSQTVSQFNWASPLGASVLLFLISGVLHLLIGALTPVLIDSEFARKVLFISNRTDTALFGIEPSALLRKNSELSKLRTLLSGVMGGWLAVIGIFTLSVAWFGLRQHQPWALITLGVAGLIMLPFWYITFRPYLHAGITFTLSDLPPVFWIPAVTLIPAVLLGWLGIR
ncbi:MAG: hypothetical protein WBD36_10500 [Bacteroidota bacterium]